MQGKIARETLRFYLQITCSGFHLTGFLFSQIESSCYKHPNSCSSLFKSMYQIFLFFFSFDIFSSFAHAKCYFPSGKELGVKYRPCVSGREFDSCCNDGMDECRPDGLCLNIDHHEIWRVGCTDPTWKSSSCIKLCYTGLGIVLDLFFRIKDENMLMIPEL